jgi:sugar phosphate isomerase/epimerase
MLPRDEGVLRRRDILAAGLWGAAALLLDRGSRAAAATVIGPYGPFKMGLQSYSLRHFKFAEALQMVDSLGLDYVEAFPNHMPMTADKAGITALKDTQRSAGVSVVGYGVVHLGKDQDANRKFFEFAKAMGIEYLSCDPEPGSFEGLDKLVEEYGIPIGIHNHGPGHRYAKIDGIMEAIKDHTPKIGCCIDTGHFLRSKEDPVRAVEVFDKRIYGVHLKDVKDATTFKIMGQGDLRTADLLKALAARKYSYCLALEYEENEASPMDDIRACLAAVKTAAAGLS